MRDIKGLRIENNCLKHQLSLKSEQRYLSLTIISCSPTTSQTEQRDSGGDQEQILPAPTSEEEPPSQGEEVQRIRQWRRTEHRPDTCQEDLHGIQQLRGGQHQHQELHQCQVKHERENWIFIFVYFLTSSSVGSYDWNNTADNISQKSNRLYVTVLQI